jgi:hypothetical protein
VRAWCSRVTSWCLHGCRRNPGYRASGAELDTTSWSNADFAKVHNARKNIFEFGELSWIEARVFNALAIGAAPPALRADIDRRLAARAASEAVSAPPVKGLVRAASGVTGPFCGRTAIGFDPATGCGFSPTCTAQLDILEYTGAGGDHGIDHNKN